MWEWGGDWSVFGDDMQHDAEQLEGWEADAVREAVKAAIASTPECEEDMAWFSDWADNAEKTIASAQVTA